MAVVLVFVLIMMIVIGVGRKAIPKMDAEQQKQKLTSDLKSGKIENVDTKSSDSKPEDKVEK